NCMTWRTHVGAVCLTVLGALLGYAAATANLNPFRLAGATAPPTIDACPAEREGRMSCTQGGCGPLQISLHTDEQIPVKAEDEPRSKSGKKPNILIIWGDDIGWFNPSCYHGGVMGYQTPNIDRIAKEGVRFTDWYGQQSCTAGRAAFITGQSPIRTGMTKVGLPGSTLGLQPEDP